MSGNQSKVYRHCCSQPFSTTSMLVMGLVKPCRNCMWPSLTWFSSCYVHTLQQLFGCLQWNKSKVLYSASLFCPFFLSLHCVPVLYNAGIRTQSNNLGLASLSRRLAWYNWPPAVYTRRKRVIAQRAQPNLSAEHTPRLHVFLCTTFLSLVNVH